MYLSPWVMTPVALQVNLKNRFSSQIVFHTVLSLLIARANAPTHA